MPVDAHKNFAYSTVATAPSPASSGTSLVVGAGEGARFPTPPFNVTIWPNNAIPLPSNAEIARVTAISTDTLTITRSQEGSTARSIGAGDQIAAVYSVKTFTDIENDYVSLAPKTNARNTILTSGSSDPQPNVPALILQATDYSFNPAFQVVAPNGTDVRFELNGYGTITKVSGEVDFLGGAKVWSPNADGTLRFSTSQGFVFYGAGIGVSWNVASMSWNNGQANALAPQGWVVNFNGEFIDHELSQGFGLSNLISGTGQETWRVHPLGWQRHQQYQSSAGWNHPTLLLKTMQTGFNNDYLQIKDSTDTILARIDQTGKFIGGGVPGNWGYTSGFYYPAIEARVSSPTDTGSFPAGRLACIPFWVRKRSRWNRVGAMVYTAAAGAFVRPGIYADNGNGMPGALIVDGGQVDASTTGSKEAVIDQWLDPGLYWIAIATQGAALQYYCAYDAYIQTRQTGVITWNDPGTATFAYAAGVYHTPEGVTGALPSTFTPGILNVRGMPLMYMRAY